MGVIFLIFAIYIFNSLLNGFADCMGSNFKKKSFYLIFMKSIFFYSLLVCSVYIITSTIIELDFVVYVIIYIFLLILCYYWQSRFVDRLRKEILNKMSS
jgi:hypothetical protein